MERLSGIPTESNSHNFSYGRDAAGSTIGRAGQEYVPFGERDGAARRPGRTIDV